jgi:hypothetical protein
MFYQADKIDRVLICKICDNEMNDPRLLPCGKSLCNTCISQFIDKENAKLKCYFNCGQMHEMPDDGFPKNQALQKILEIQSTSELSQCKQSSNGLTSIFRYFCFFLLLLFCKPIFTDAFFVIILFAFLLFVISLISFFFVIKVVLFSSLLFFSLLFLTFTFCLS